MDKHELLELLQDGAVANALNLTPKHFEPTERFAVLQIIPENAKLCIEQAVIDQTTGDDRLVIEGQTELFKAHMSVKAVFTFVGNDLQRYYILFIPAVDWKLETSFPDLPALQTTTQSVKPLPDGAKFIKPIFVVSMNHKTISDTQYALKRVSVQDGVNFYAEGLSKPFSETIFPEDVRTAFGKVLSRVPDSISGLVTPTGIQSSLTLRYGWQTSGDKFGDSAVQSIALTYFAALNTKTANVLFERTLDVNGSPVVLAGSLNEAQPAYQTDFDETLTPTSFMDTINSLTGRSFDIPKALPFDFDGAPVTLNTFKHVPKEYTAVSFTLGTDSEPFNWSPLDGMTMREVDTVLRYDARTRKTDYNIVGTLELLGVPFEVSYETGPIISGNLHEDAHVSVLAFLEDLFGMSPNLPNAQLDLQTAMISYNGATKELSLALGVAGSIDLFGNGQFVVRGLSFQYARTGAETTLRYFSGTADLCGVDVSVSAQLLTGGAWEVQVEAGNESPISLTGLLRTLLNALNVPLPASAPDIAVQNLSFEYNTQDSTLTLSGTTTYQIPRDIPLFDKPKAIAADLYLMVGKDAKGQRALTVSIDWTQQFTDGELNASVGYNGAWSAYVGWDGQAGKKITLRSLHSGLHLDSLFDLPEGVDWDIFGFKAFSLRYQTANRALQVRALTELAGTELELAGNLTQGERAFELAWANKTTVHITDILNALGLDSDIVPDELASALLVSGLRASYQVDPQPRILFVAESKTAFYNRAFVIADKVGGKWAFTAGATFTNPDLSPADVPGLGDVPGLSEVLDMIILQPNYLMYSTLDQPKFAFPSVLTGVESKAVEFIKLKNGLTLAATIKFNKKSEIIANVKSLIGDSELRGRMTVSSTGLDLTAQLGGTLTIPTGNSDTLRLQEAAFNISASKLMVNFGVSGKMQMQLFGELRELEAMLVVGPTAAVMNLHVVNGDILSDSGFVPSFIPTFPSLPAFPGVKLVQDDYYLQLGSQFTPPAFNFGYIGQFYIGRDRSRYNGKFSLVLQVIEGVPNVLALVMSMSEFDLWALMEAQWGVMTYLERAKNFAGFVKEVQNEPGLDFLAGMSEDGFNFLMEQSERLRDVLHKIHFKFPYIHWADEPTILPDGTTLMPGIGFQGLLEAFGFRAYAMLEASTSGGKGGIPRLRGLATFDPITIENIVEIKGKGVGIPKRAGNWSPGDPMISDGKLKTNSKAITPSTEYWVQPGGPVLMFATDSTPLLYGDIEINLFNFLHASAHAEIDLNGMMFELISGAGDVLETRLKCQAYLDNGWIQMQADGSMKFALDFDVPIPLSVIGDGVNFVTDALGLGSAIDLDDMSIHINTNFDAHVQLRFGAEIGFKIGGSFEFEGAGFTVPELSFSIPARDYLTKGITSAAGFIKLIVSHILDHAGAIFADLFAEIGNMFGKAWQAVSKFVEDVGETVVEIGQAAVREAEAAFDTAKEAASAVGREVAQAADAAIAAAEKTIENLEQGAKELASNAIAIGEQAVKKAAEIADEALKTAENAIKAGKEALENAGRVVAEVAAAVAQELVQVGRQIAEVAQRAAQEVQRVLNQAAEIAGQAIAAAREYTEAALREAERIASAIYEQAERLFNEAEQLANEALEFGKAALEAVENFASDAADAIGGAAEDVGNAFVSIFDW